MILVDTSVWVAHLRFGDTGLESLLQDDQVAVHDFIIGELACGQMKNRAELIELLNSLPKAVQAEHHEVMTLIEDRKLMGRGLGYVDMHLVASARLTGITLWTLDKNLLSVINDLGLAIPKFMQ